MRPIWPLTNDREQNLWSRRPLSRLSLTPIQCQARVQWWLAPSIWNCAGWGHAAFSVKSSFLLCPDNHQKCVWRCPASMGILPLLLHATEAHNRPLWFRVPFLLIAGPLVVISYTSSTAEYMTFCDLFCCRSFCITLDFLFTKIMLGRMCCYEFPSSLPNTSLSS